MDGGGKGGGAPGALRAWHGAWHGEVAWRGWVQCGAAGHSGELRVGSERISARISISSSRHSSATLACTPTSHVRARGTRLPRPPCPPSFI